MISEYSLLQPIPTQPVRIDRPALREQGEHRMAELARGAR